MINKVIVNISSTAGLTIDELRGILRTGVGVFIVDKMSRETRFVFSPRDGIYRIKYLGNYDPSSYSREVKKLLSRSYDTIYEGSTLNTYYKHLTSPSTYHRISIVNEENTPVKVETISTSLLKDFT